MVELLLEQHRAIYQAIAAGQPEQARQAMQDHLSLVEDKMSELLTEQIAE